MLFGLLDSISHYYTTLVFSCIFGCGITFSSLLWLSSS
uniref:Uncharacterized protein n=1 Tax=Rhizophora mucronata TaxID=61149 RepID=A0A2P2N3J1_RHIMU